jgi:hypothetical protein
VYEIRAAHRNCTISFFPSGSEVGWGEEASDGRVDGGRERPAAPSPLAASSGRGRRGWEVGRPEVRVSGFWVVEVAEPGGYDDGGSGGVMVRVRGFGSPRNERGSGAV